MPARAWEFSLCMRRIVLGWGALNDAPRSGPTPTRRVVTVVPHYTPNRYRRAMLPLARALKAEGYTSGSHGFPWLSNQHRGAHTARYS
jgi:hypothetical protein